MIRLAFLGVFALAGLLAFGAFFLARGDRGADVQITANAPAPAVDAPEPATVEKLFYLRDIDMDSGDITLMLFGAGPANAKMVVRDVATLKAAQDTAYVNATDQAGGGFVMMPIGVPPSEAFAQVYRNDVLIATISCTNTTCGSFAENPDVQYGGLLDAAMPAERVNDNFDTYDDYLATIEGITQDPDFMLLDMRPPAPFPAPRRRPALIVELPNVVVAADAPFDAAAHETLVRDTLDPLLPDGATIQQVRITAQGFGVLSDKDNNRPVMVNGAEVPFLNAQFYAVQVTISGTTTLTAAAFDTLTDATRQRYDTDSEFADFVTGTLPTSCVDCYFLQVTGPFGDTARAVDWVPETYSLSYYDLRDAP